MTRQNNTGRSVARRKSGGGFRVDQTFIIDIIDIIGIIGNADADGDREEVLGLNRTGNVGERMT